MKSVGGYQRSSSSAGSGVSKTSRVCRDTERCLNVSCPPVGSPAIEANSARVSASRRPTGGCKTHCSSHRPTRGRGRRPWAPCIHRTRPWAAIPLALPLLGRRWTRSTLHLLAKDVSGGVPSRRGGRTELVAAHGCDAALASEPERQVLSATGALCGFAQRVRDGRQECVRASHPTPACGRVGGEESLALVWLVLRAIEGAECRDRGGVRTALGSRGGGGDGQQHRAARDKEQSPERSSW